MMFSALSGLGQIQEAIAAYGSPINSTLATPMGSADCQWCVANPGLAILSPSCWAANFNGSCSQVGVAQAYAQGAAAPVVSAEGLYAGAAQDPNQLPADATISTQIAATQAAAIAAANAAAQAETTGPDSQNLFDLPNIPGLPPNASSAFWILLAFGAGFVILDLTMTAMKK